MLITDNLEGCTCQSCGKKYKVDLLVPDSLWKEIKPNGKPDEGGLLCGSCIMKRIEKLGNFGVLEAISLSDQRPETAYKLHFRTNFQGIPISVENRKGSYRRGVDPDGNPWEIKMDFHYGRIPRTRGADGDAVDVFIGPEKTSDKVFIIEQVWPDTGKFDEHKVMLGFLTKAEAIRGYKSQYNRPGFYGGCITMSIQEFKAWLKEQAPRKVERRNLENRVINGQRVIIDSKGKDMKIIEDDGVITGGITDESNFDKLVKKLMKENGYSEDRAKRIAYSIGVKKYGKAGMAAKSVAGRKGDADLGMDNGTEPVEDVAPTPIITGDFITDEEMESISEMEDDYLGWDKLVKELMAKGHSKKSAENIAATIGRKKYGAAGMAAKAAAGRDKVPMADENAGKKLGSKYRSIIPDLEKDPNYAMKIRKIMPSISSAIHNIEQKEALTGASKLDINSFKNNLHGLKSYVSGNNPKILKVIKEMELISDGMLKKAVAGRDAEITETLQSEGKHIGTDYSQYDPKELALGILVEKEHADDPIDRMEIASDHLEEKQNYYSDPSSFFLSELRKEYGDKLVPEYQKALEYVNKVISGEVPVQDADINTVVLEAAATPVIKKLMQAMGFKKLFWKGSGWVIPIGLDEYGNYLKMIPRLKIYDAMLQKFGYEISLAPGWFKIVPLKPTVEK